MTYRESLIAAPDRLVTYGPWEPRTDLPLIRKQTPDPWRGVVVERLAHVIDRKVMTTWIEDGQKMGRWTWESGL